MPIKRKTGAPNFLQRLRKRFHRGSYATSRWNCPPGHAAHLRTSEPTGTPVAGRWIRPLPRSTTVMNWLCQFCFFGSGRSNRRRRLPLHQIAIDRSGRTAVLASAKLKVSFDRKYRPFSSASLGFPERLLLAKLSQWQPQSTAIAANGCSSEGPRNRTRPIPGVR